MTSIVISSNDKLGYRPQASSSGSGPRPHILVCESKSYYHIILTKSISAYLANYRLDFDDYRFKILLVCQTKSGPSTKMLAIYLKQDRIHKLVNFDGGVSVDKVGFTRKEYLDGRNKTRNVCLVIKVAKH